MKPPAFLTPILLGGFLSLIAPASGIGQFAPYSGQADLNGMAQGLADRVRHLGEDIATEMAGNPAARHLMEDTQEMAIAVDEFRGTLQGRPDMNRAGLGFTDIDQTWQHLRAQITRPGVAPATLGRAIDRVDETVNQFRQVLNVNPPPPAFNGYGPAPTGIADTQRLAHALVNRAQSLASAIQVSMAGDPNAIPLTNDAVRLIQVADTFHDSIDSNQPIGVAAQAFAPVDQLSNRVEQFVTSGRVPPQVQQAWQAFASVEVLIHQNLGLNTPQPAVQYSLAPPPGGGPSPMVGLSAQLVDQVNAYIATFSTTAKHEPEGFAALSDAQRLLAAAINFRQDASQGLPPNQLAYEFRDVDANCQRLLRRASRIARGRNGPYVQQAQAIGGTCEQIHNVLGMTGQAPAYFGNGGPVPPPPPPGSGQFR